MNWLDWVLMTILVVSALRGLTRGFVRSVAGFAAVIFGFWIALHYYHRLGDYMEVNLGWGPSLTDFIAQHLRQAAQSPLTATPPTEPVTPLGGLFAGAVASLLQGVASFLASSALDAVAFLLILALATTVLNMVVGVIPSLSLLAPLDRAGGFCFGLLRGFLLGVLVFALVHFAAEPGSVTASTLAPSYEAALNYLWALVGPGLSIEPRPSAVQYHQWC